MEEGLKQTCCPTGKSPQVLYNFNCSLTMKSTSVTACGTLDYFHPRFRTHVSGFAQGTAAENGVCPDSQTGFCCEWPDCEASRRATGESRKDTSKWCHFRAGKGHLSHCAHGGDTYHTGPERAGSLTSPRL